MFNYTCSSKNTSHYLYCHLSGASEHGQEAMIASSIKYLNSFCSDTKNYDIPLDRCTPCIFCWNVFFNPGEIVIASRKAFQAHFILCQNDPVTDKTSIQLWAEISRKKGINWLKKNWFGLVSLFNGISNFVGYLMPKPFFLKNISGTI